ncbi:HlyD family secretion protein [Legionella beliardensis]|uniref:HlyD family secretion protein n=1 Tax=Legionella beliardensis TaxID=91822 RepID=A0A378I0C9_9GAMM|nr:efflux RND transporter periplasmic adaptor subunit [Legionella beliardensis]STX28648.1 HlyD family secretion protein [Legionella beliardensis]
MISRVHQVPGQLKRIAKVTLLVLLVSCSDAKPPAVQPKVKVTVTQVKTSYIPIYKEYIGITKSIASVDIRARVKGFLIKMNFVEGKLVKKNQLLYVIDPKPFEAKLNLAQGQLSKSIAAKEYQQIEFLRMRDLVKKGDVAKARFDEVTAQYREAVAQVEIETAEVEEAKINLSYCSMYSPIDGIISHKYVDVGNLVGGTENTLLANVVQLNPIYVEFNPSTSDYSEFLQYRANMPFKVEVSLPHDKKDVFHGKVDLINNQAQVSTSTILMRAVVDNPQNLLLPGIYVNVRLTLTDKSPAILVPILAVVQTQELRSVYVVTSANKVQSRTITISGQEGENYIIKSGLKDGDMVILNGLQKIQPGMEVIPQVSK